MGPAPMGDQTRRTSEAARVPLETTALARQAPTPALPGVASRDGPDGTTVRTVMTGPTVTTARGATTGAGAAPAPLADSRADAKTATCVDARAAVGTNAVAAVLVVTMVAAPQMIDVPRVPARPSASSAPSSRLFRRGSRARNSPERSTTSCEA